MKDLEAKLNKLPSYIYCKVCDQKHYLSFNRDIQGKYSVGYVEFENHTAILAENGFDTLEAAVDFIEKELK